MQLRAVLFISVLFAIRLYALICLHVVHEHHRSACNPSEPNEYDAGALSVV